MTSACCARCGPVLQLYVCPSMSNRGGCILQPRKDVYARASIMKHRARTYEGVELVVEAARNL